MPSALPLAAPRRQKSYSAAHEAWPKSSLLQKKDGGGEKEVISLSSTLTLTLCLLRNIFF